MEVLSSMQGAGEAARWYVLRSKPRKEKYLFQYAQSQGHELFFPRIPVKPVNPRAAKIRAYFPGYMFVKTCLDVIGESTFRWMPCSAGLVYVGGEPAPLSEIIVRAIRDRVAGIWEAGGLQLEGLKKGDPVLIREGMFEGYEAIFDASLPGKERVRVLLKMLNDRFVPVELQTGIIQSLKK